VLGPGDHRDAPAVGRLDRPEASALLIDEAALTGESAPVDKSAGPDGSTADVSAGTVVVRGRGQALITATGAASAMGRIAAMMTTAPAMTPLQRRLAGVGRLLAAAALVLCAVVLAVGVFRGQPLQLMIVTAITLVVAAVPESLPAVVTLSLALGAVASVGSKGDSFDNAMAEAFNSLYKSRTRPQQRARGAGSTT
jgi:P-type E1-E2 ATPase